MGAAFYRDSAGDWVARISGGIMPTMTPDLPEAIVRLVLEATPRERIKIATH